METSRYFKRGIKNKITRDDLKVLWFRDKGYAMKRPSIDRIDSDGDYTFDNCRYIEQAENARLGNLGKKLNDNQMETVLKNIKKAKLRGVNV